MHITRARLCVRCEVGVFCKEISQLSKIHSPPLLGATYTYLNSSRFRCMGEFSRDYGISHSSTSGVLNMSCKYFTRLINNMMPHAAPSAMCDGAHGAGVRHWSFIKEHSLVPRSRGRREKWPGIHCLRMCENPHDFMGYRIPSFTNLYRHAQSFTDKPGNLFTFGNCQ